MKVLESKETPGLGDKIEKDSTFIGEFLGVGTPLLAVKKGRESGVHEEVVMITGATISSKAIIQIINNRLEGVREPVTTYWSSPAMVAGAPPVPPTDSGGGGS
jgi:electron transport complex protein RnfG